MEVHLQAGLKKRYFIPEIFIFHSSEKDDDDSNDKCGKHEHYDEFGSPCQETCETLDDPQPCVLMFDPGCFCDDGYVRKTEGGPCIEKTTCPSKLLCLLSKYGWKMHIMF